MSQSKKPNTLRVNAPKVSGTIHGTHSERRVAKKVGAKLTPGSGSKAGAKGDARMDSKRTLPIMVESKSTTDESMGLKREWLVKLSMEAANIGRDPVLTLSFVGPDGRSKRHGDWAVIPLSMLQSLLE